MSLLINLLLSLNQARWDNALLTDYISHFASRLSRYPVLYIIHTAKTVQRVLFPTYIMGIRKVQRLLGRGG